MRSGAHDFAVRLDARFRQPLYQRLDRVAVCILGFVVRGAYAQSRTTRDIPGYDMALRDVQDINGTRHATDLPGTDLRRLVPFCG